MKEKPQLLSETEVLILGNNGNWAKGETAEAAKAEIRKLGRVPTRFLLYVVHPKTTVTEDGRLEWTRGFPPKLIQRVGCKENAD